jgi:uncharacterized protein (DUF924 family)
MTNSQTTDIPVEAADVLNFWFQELTPEQWWVRDDAVDDAIRDRFQDLYETISEAVPDEWLETPRGRLAAVIVLDQFPRNLFRNSANAFASDAMALQLAKETVGAGLDQALTRDERVFLYLPFEHSEDKEMQEFSVTLYEKLGDADTLDFAKKHKQVIDRFGRFPHRNAVLGRETTEEERRFLEQESWFW